MKLTAHLVRKDWRRARPALLAWYALVAGKAWCVWQLSRSADAGLDFDFLGSCVDSLNGLEAVVGALLAARLVLEDPLQNPNAFWPTRPIGRGRLLLAKSLAASLFFLVVPLLLLAPVWIASAFSVPEFFAAAADWALLQGVCCALGMLGGALARDLYQLLLGGPLLGLGLFGVSAFLASDDRAPGLLAGLVLLLAVTGLVLTYRLRRRAPSLALLLLGGLVVAGFGRPPSAPPDSLRAWPGPPLAWRHGEAREAGPRTWRFVALRDEPFHCRLVVQHTRPVPALLAASDAGQPSPFFTEETPSGDTGVRLIPERLGTVRTASLHVTRWRFTTAPRPEAFILAGSRSRLVAHPAVPAQP